MTSTGQSASTIANHSPSRAQTCSGNPLPRRSSIRYSTPGPVLTARSSIQGLMTKPLTTAARHRGGGGATGAPSSATTGGAGGGGGAPPKTTAAGGGGRKGAGRKGGGKFFFVAPPRDRWGPARGRPRRNN